MTASHFPSDSSVESSDILLPAVCEELRHLAARQLASERPGQTLQTTALVHETCLRLAASRPSSWQTRRHFFGAAAEAMRRILIENAGRKKRLKHGGDRQRVELHEANATSGEPREDLIAVNGALKKLELGSPARAELVKLRYFAGMSLDEAAEVLGLSRTTAYRQWVYAGAWLCRELSDERD